jgi:hypothetical protein
MLSRPKIRAAIARVRLTPARRWAAVFLLLAAGCVVVWITTNAADEWMPNAGTGAVTIALTITLVEGIVQREKRDRESGRAAGAYGRLELALVRLMQTVAMDYFATHLRSDIEFAWNPVEVIRHWIEDDEDTPRRDRGDGNPPFVLTATLEFADAVKRVVEADREILPNDLVAAMNEVVEHAARAVEFDASFAQPQQGLHLWKTLDILHPARVCATRLRAERPEAWASLYRGTLRVPAAIAEDQTSE